VAAESGHGVVGHEYVLAAGLTKTQTRFSGPLSPIEFIYFLFAY
jgi:hypothetical protein